MDEVVREEGTARGRDGRVSGREWEGKMEGKGRRFWSDRMGRGREEMGKGRDGEGKRWGGKA